MQKSKLAQTGAPVKNVLPYMRKCSLSKPDQQEHPHIDHARALA